IAVGARIRSVAVNGTYGSNFVAESDRLPSIRPWTFLARQMRPEMFQEVVAMVRMRLNTSLAVMVVPAIALLVGGCYYSAETTSQPVAAVPAPVVVTPVPAVVTPAPPAVVAAPAVTAAPGVYVAPSQRVVSYPEGRFELYGDSATGYYWVWVPTG